MPVWQVNAHQSPRPCWPAVGNQQWRAQYYGDLFLQYGVALIGPGRGGAFPNFVAPCYAGPGAAAIVERFAAGPAIGDIILLRPGTLRHIHAVGIVASDYQFLDQFDNVYGWDLQHARRVHLEALSAQLRTERFLSCQFLGCSEPLSCPVRPTVYSATTD